MALDFARFGQKEQLEMMLEAKLPINLSDHKGNTLLMLAAYHGNTDIVKMLLERGAQVDCRNDRGQTPLEGVCFKGYLDVAKLLVEYGAQTKNAAFYASIFGNKKIVNFLYRHQNGFKAKLYLVLSKVTSLFRRKIKA